MRDSARKPAPEVRHEPNREGPIPTEQRTRILLTENIREDSRLSILLENMKRTSSCSCGEVTLTTDSEPTRVSICHCFECQKRTGSVLGVQARFFRNQVVTEGRTTQYVRVVGDSEKITFHFCPQCGSTLYWFMESLPELIGTGVGNFTDPGFPNPTVAVFENRKHSWIEIPGLKVQRFNVIDQ